MQVYYAGRVQGVGFRYTACRIAGGFDVTGYVRNLPDGQVECVVEGESAEIDAFLADLSDQMRRHIHRQSRRTAAHTGRFRSFGVEY